MKIAGIIFSILILSLNAIPCCWESCSEEEPVEEHTGTEQTCSPFLSCGSCVGFVLQEELPEISLYLQPSVTEIKMPENRFFSEFSETIWQPPKPIMNFSFSNKG
ncbi:hypothetical protein [Salinimicrobium flavum]|uniref:Secreted protein n=1 Tax=Salinimicrobium flavum TaxID=1737065 RepID=A0ABW5IWX7_9FLAO